MSVESRKQGHLFGKWKIDKKIGQGANGVVYRLVSDTAGMEDESALKIITVFEQNGKKELLSAEVRAEMEQYVADLRDKALQEVRLMRKLRGNTNIVDYLDSDWDDWIEEDCYGSDLLIRVELLHDLVSEQQMGRVFAEEEIIRLGKDICNALVLCHGKQIVHRDIKPANIYRNDNGSYKLGDFGISRIIDEAQANEVTVGKGTRPYMAPEQFRQDMYDRRVDIYSLGLVLYELGNGNRLPFARGLLATEVEVQDRMMGKTFPNPAQVGDSLAKVIMKACAYKPEDRYQSAQEFLNALNRLDSMSNAYGLHNEKATESFEENDLYRTMPAEANVAEDIYATCPADGQEQKEQDIYATCPADGQEQKEQDIYATRPAAGQNQQEQDSYEARPANGQEQVTVDRRVQELIERANQGDPISQCNLAWCYEMGDGVENIPSEAAKWYRRAAEQGDATGQANLAACYENARGVEQDLKEAVKWYFKAAEQGYAVAQNNLGVCFYDGKGVDRDYKEAIKWYFKAVEQDNHWAQRNLGEAYAEGNGVEQNLREAVKWYLKSAEQGNASAQNYIGVCYEDGDGVGADIYEAVKWYHKAAEQGEAWGQLNLARCYQEGNGVELDAYEAVKWFRKSAEQGNVDAQNYLGTAYHHGNGIGQDYDEAIMWYRKAAAQGDSCGQFNLGWCYENGTGVAQNYEKAINWYRQAAEQGNTDAQDKLKQLQG